MIIVTVEYTYRALISVDTDNPVEATLIVKSDTGIRGAYMSTQGNRVIDYELDSVPDCKVVCFPYRSN